MILVFPAAAAAYGDQNKVKECLVNWFGSYEVGYLYFLVFLNFYQHIDSSRCDH
jgi:hypothetical protein